MGWTKCLRRLSSDRFVIFSLIGVAFFLYDAMRDRSDNLIVVSEAEIEMLEGRWQRQSGSRPTPSERDALIEHYIEEEVYVREAQRLGLDQDDVILRRRLAQKMELLIKSQIEEPDLEQAAVRRFFSEHGDLYRVPSRLALRHIYLGSDNEAPADLASDIQETLKTSTEASAWRQLGEAFMLAREYAPGSQAEYAEAFGTEFSDQVFADASQRDWFGPVRSAYGWHLVQVLSFTPEDTPELDEIFDVVARDLRANLLNKSEARVQAEMLAKYDVDIRRPNE